MGMRKICLLAMTAAALAGCSSTTSAPSDSGSVVVAPAGGCVTAKGLTGNAAIAVKFLLTGINDRQPQQAADQYLSNSYHQHHPGVSDGPQGFVQLMQSARAQAPGMKSCISHVIADGDYVTIHHLSTNSPQDRGTAIADIFRLSGGKIVEHWDVIQAVPDGTDGRSMVF
jgi:predicted SnoaL-like aldol condensation-catalyzing enzyme